MIQTQKSSQDHRIQSPQLRKEEEWQGRNLPGAAFFIVDAGFTLEKERNSHTALWDDGYHTFPCSRQHSKSQAFILQVSP